MAQWSRDAAPEPLSTTERLTTKPPLCQECAKTGRNRTTILRPGGDDKPAVSWAFQDAMAPHETR